MLENVGYCRLPDDTYRNLAEGHWSYTDEKPDNPVLILAQVLEQRRLGVRFLDSETSEGDVEIHVSHHKGEVLLDRIIRTPELGVLINVIRLGVLDPRIRCCHQWIADTQKRIEALALQKQPDHSQKQADLITSTDIGPGEQKATFLKVAQNASNEARRILGNLDSLTPDDIRGLIEAVVEREIIPASQAA